MNDRQIKVLLVGIPLVLAGMFVYDRVYDRKGGDDLRTDGTDAAFQKEETVRTVRSVWTLMDDYLASGGANGKNYYIKRLSAVYTAEIGVRELTGKNDGKRVEEYLASCGLGKGYAWCAAFVNWCMVQSGVRGAGSAWSPDWFPSANTIYTRGGRGNINPSKCDVMGLYYADKKRIAHVGFIDDWAEGSDYTLTVEGNTNDDGSREGDGVYRKRRLKAQVYRVSRWI